MSVTTQTLDQVSARGTKPWLFKPGQSGNPSGKPTGFGAFRDAMRERYAERAMVKLGEATEAGAPWAIELTLAYAWGKPTQVIEGNLNGVTINVVSALPRSPDDPDPPTIEGTASIR